MSKDEFRQQVIAQLPAYVQEAIANAHPRSSVRRAFNAGVWRCDRDITLYDEDAKLTGSSAEIELWTRLRDAAGFTPGQSPKPLDE